MLIRAETASDEAAVDRLLQLAFETPAEARLVKALRLNRALTVALVGERNGSLVGASANLVVAGFAERANQPIRFVPFLLTAFPLMLMSVACVIGGCGVVSSDRLVTRSTGTNTYSQNPAPASCVPRSRSMTARPTY